MALYNSHGLTRVSAMVKWLILISSLASCMARDKPTYTKLRSQEPELWWIVAAQQAEQERLARCPGLTKGCFVGGNTCVVTICFCPRVCEPNTNAGRVWQPAAGDCRCE